jgi:hypothetical protein
MRFDVVRQLHLAALRAASLLVMSSNPNAGFDGQRYMRRSRPWRSRGPRICRFAPPGLENDLEKRRERVSQSTRNDERTLASM